jgi:hypothetical protein
MDLILSSSLSSLFVSCPGVLWMRRQIDRKTLNSLMSALLSEPHRMYRIYLPYIKLYAFTCEKSV